MTKMPPVAKFAILGVTILAALIAGWLILIGPQRSEASKLKAEIDSTHAQIDAAQIGSSGAAPQAQTIRVADLFKLSRAMPDRADIPNVLLQLSAISAETGVAFQSITPHEPVSLGSYQQIGIDLVFEGHFYDLSDFLYRLRNLVGVHQGVLGATGRLFSVDSVSFDEGALQFPQVKATLTVSAYVFGDGTLTLAPTVLPGSTEAAPATPTPATQDDSQPIPAAPPGATAAGA